MWRVGCRCLRRTLWVSCRGWSSVLNYEIKLIFKAVVNWMRLNPERYTLFVDSKTFSSIHLLNIAIIIIVHAQLYSQSNSACMSYMSIVGEFILCIWKDDRFWRFGRCLALTLIVWLLQSILHSLMGNFNDKICNLFCLAPRQSQ